MAKITIPEIEIDVPDGEYCNDCGYRMYGKIWCKLFSDYVYETEDYNNHIKCKSCPR